MPKFTKNNVYVNNSILGGPANLSDQLYPTFLPNSSGVLVEADHVTDSQYLYTSRKSDLRLWLRCGTQLADLSGYSPKPTTVAYTSLAVVSQETTMSPGTNKVKLATFNDTAAKAGYALYSSIDNGINFANPAGGDLPFSISFWAQSSETSGDGHLIGTRSGAMPADDDSYGIWYDSVGFAGTVYFRLWDTGGDWIQAAMPAFNSEFNGKLVHFVFTYDGSLSEEGLAIYVNGVKRAIIATSSGTYNGMQGTATQLNIGREGDNTDEFDGEMGEVAVWGTELTPKLIKTIYYSSVYSTFLPKSGFISNPPRYLLKQWDSATGSYPTIARTGDVSRKGNYNVSFNDTDVVVFDDPYAEAIVNFDVEYKKEVVNLRGRDASSATKTETTWTDTMSMYSSIQPEDLISPKDDDTVVLTDSYGTAVTFTFKSGINLAGWSSSEIQLPIDTFDRNLLATNFVKKVNAYPNLQITAHVVAETEQVRLGPKKVLANGTVGLRQIKPGSVGNTSITATMTLDTTYGIKSGFSAPSAFTGGKDITVNYPTLLQASAPQKLFKQSYATPNILGNSLDNSAGIVRKGIADSHLRFTPGEDLVAFDDSRINLKGGIFFNEGTPGSILPGFSAPLGSKTQLDFNIGTDTEQHVFRQTGGRNPAGEFANESFTGLCYYNWELGRWDQTGLNDPGTGNPIPYDFAMDKTGGDFVSGSNNMVGQFGASEGLYFAKVVDPVIYSVDSLGYTYACSPHMAFGAPFSNRYHATSSNCLDMSNYLTAPFLLEKLTLSVPVYARADYRHYNNSTVTDPSHVLTADEMNNYVFFIYLQTANRKPGYSIDSQNYVTSSNRILIASASACFYLPEVLKEVGPSDQTSPFEPIHSPAWKHKWDLTGLELDVPSDGWYMQFTGSIDLNFFPAVTPSLNSGIGYINESNDTDDAAPFVYAWPGGSSILPFNTNIDENFSGKGDDELPKFRYGGDQIFDDLTNNISNLANMGITDLNNSRHGMVNSRGGSPSTGEVSPDWLTTTAGECQSAQSPFLLFPGDKLVLAVEKAGSRAHTLTDLMRVGAYKLSPHAAHIESLSGSLLTMAPGQGKMTFFGSQVKDKVEFHDTLSQNLTSDAVHEAIHFDNPTIDQFQIEPETSYIGSYLDDYVDISADDYDTGGTAVPTLPFKVKALANKIGRPVYSILSGGLAPVDKSSFLRNVQIPDVSSIFFDSLLPDVTEVLRSAGFVSYPSSSIKYTVEDLDAAGSEWVAEYRSPFRLRIGGKSVAFCGHNPDDDIAHGASSTTVSILMTDNGMPADIVNRFGTDYLRRIIPRPDDLKYWTFEHKVYYPTPLQKLYQSPSIVYPYRGDPERQTSGNSQLTIVFDEIKSISFDSSDSTIDTLAGGAPRILPLSTVDMLIASGASPIVEYLNGINLLNSLFGGAAADESFASLFPGPLTVVGKIQEGETAYRVGGRYDEPILSCPVLSNAGLGSPYNVIPQVLKQAGETLAYGLVNTVPTRKKYYFRSDRYTGQVADMLGQGIDTRLYAETGGSVSEQVWAAYQAMSPISVQFVSGSFAKSMQNTNMTQYNRVTPIMIVGNMGSQSSNISLHATSSMPFIDDNTPYNRTYLPPIIVV